VPPPTRGQHGVRNEIEAFVSVAGGVLDQLF
jgi:hypothetical protein